SDAFLVDFKYYVPREVPVKLEDFPHIIDFEPKARDLYQAATESGEILTASVSAVKTDKTFAHTQSSETGLSLSGTVGIGQQQGTHASLTGAFSHKWGDTDQDVTTAQV